MAKQLKSTIAWINKHWETIKNDNHCWTNTSKLFDESEVEKIKKFMEKKQEIALSIVIVGIKPLRAQWVAASIPEYFRSNNAYHELHYEENSFWFISCNDQNHELFKERLPMLKDSLESIKKEVPECEIMVFER